MRETPYRDEHAELVAIETSGLVKAIADALSSHWPGAIDLHEKLRSLPSNRATLLRRGQNAAGVSVLAAASVEITEHDRRPAYALRGLRRKLHYVDDVILDVLPGWDQEQALIALIREHAMELIPEEVRDVPSPDALRQPGSVIWGTLRLRDGSEKPGAAWRIEEYDAGFDTLRGQYVSPSSSQPKPLSARASAVEAWSIGLVPATAP